MRAHELNNTLPYAHPDEIDFLTQFVNKNKDIKTVVMLGAGPGVFALAILDGVLTRNIKLHVIDNQTCEWVLRHANHDSRIITHIQDSWEPLYNLETVDLLLVDADHTYEAVKRDINTWQYKSRYIFFHDYLERDRGFNGSGEWVLSGVARAVEQHLDKERFTLFNHVGISMFYGLKE